MDVGRARALLRKRQGDASDRTETGQRQDRDRQGDTGWPHVGPCDRCVSGRHLAGLLNVRTVQQPPCLKGDDLLTGRHGYWRIAVFVADNLIRAQHLQAYGDLNAERLVATETKKTTSVNFKKHKKQKGNRK